MCERWVGDWTNCNILTPNSFVFSSTSFSFCWAAQSGVLRAHSPPLGAGSLYSILSPTNWLQLTEPVCGPGLYNCLICFLWASHLHRIQPVHGQGYTLISSTECTCSSIDGWVEGLYVTLEDSPCTWLWQTWLKQSTPVRLNKEFDSKFRIGSRDRHETPEEGRKTLRPKR